MSAIVGFVVLVHPVCSGSLCWPLCSNAFWCGVSFDGWVASACDNFLGKPGQGVLPMHQHLQVAFDLLGLLLLLLPAQAISQGAHSQAREASSSTESLTWELPVNT